MKNVIDDAIEEFLIDQTWELHRHFMHEVEREVGCHVPVDVLISCENVALKWAEYVRNN